jgi:hypothetical protein
MLERNSRAAKPSLVTVGFNRRLRRVAGKDFQNARRLHPEIKDSPSGHRLPTGR